ncbi:MAG: MerR family transcriptional regulator [Proteobacteria bacterium]|nr:MAG: MerR family transcriptional regulator [Pseudomonadota bacterium]
MSQQELIAASAFCSSHNIDIAFVAELSESGLLNTTVIEDSIYLLEDQLPELERMVRFHYEMEINVQGIETINHLLFRMQQMQEEMRSLRNRLYLYEQPE